MKRDNFRRTVLVVFGLLAIFSIAHWEGASALAQIPGGGGQHEGVGLHSRKLMAPSDGSQALNALKEIQDGLSKHVIIQLDWIPNATERKTFSCGVRNPN